MPIGTQSFGLPINSVKKETSLQDKILIKSHGDDNLPTYFETMIDRRVHTKSVKVKFFIIGYRLLTQSHIDYIGDWVELEPHQRVYKPVVTGGIQKTFQLGFYPFSIDVNNQLFLRLQLFPYPTLTQHGEIYIEKLSVIDSDFNSDLSWITDTTIPPIIPDVNGLLPPEPPIITLGMPNTVWID